MGVFTGFEKGSGGTYKFQDNGELVKVSDSASTPWAGLNGPVWFPKGGTKYFDKSLRKVFYSKQEKIDFMRENHIRMSDDQKNYKGVEAKGVGSTYFSYGGMKTCNPTYKYR